MYSRPSMTRLSDSFKNLIITAGNTENINARTYKL